jgi:hypothetical protein
VTVSSIYDAKVNYSHLEDLAPGKDKSLDRIGEFLTNGRALYHFPTIDDRARTTADEDAFFEELTHPEDYLSNVRYERWLRLRILGRSAQRLLRRVPFGVGNALLSLGRRRWNLFLTWMEKHG